MKSNGMIFFPEYPVAVTHSSYLIYRTDFGWKITEALTKVLVPSWKIKHEINKKYTSKNMTAADLGGGKLGSLFLSTSSVPLRPSSS